MIDHLISAVRFKEPIDILKIVDNIREDRMCMIQHTEQYRFAYQAALDIIRQHVDSPTKIYCAMNDGPIGRNDSWDKHASNG